MSARYPSEFATDTYGDETSPPPMPRTVRRWEELQRDLAQERVVAELEVPRIGRRRAMARLGERVARELAWFQRTNTRFVIRTGDRDGDD